MVMAVLSAHISSPSPSSSSSSCLLHTSACFSLSPSFLGLNEFLKKSRSPAVCRRRRRSRRGNGLLTTQQAQTPPFFLNHKQFQQLTQILDSEEDLKSIVARSSKDGRRSLWSSTLSAGVMTWLFSGEDANAKEDAAANMVYEIGEFFELGIQLSYLLILLGLLGVGSFFVVRQILVRRELDLSAKELQEQVRSGDASATGYFELGAVMLRRKVYPAAIKYLQQAIDRWDGDAQDLAQVHNALGVCYMRDGKLDLGITEFKKAVKLQPGYVTAWNNLGDAYDKKKNFRAAFKAFEEALLFDPNNKVARPRRDDLKQKADLYRGVPSEEW